MGRLPHRDLHQNLYTLSHFTPCWPLLKNPGLSSPFRDQFYNTNKFITCQFVLDKHLRLNLTFLDLYIPTKFQLPFRSCWSGVVIVTSKVHNAQSPLFYCERLAYVAVFPTSNQVSIEVKAKPFVIVEATMSFSIRDRNVVESIPVQQTGNVAPKWSFYIGKNNGTLIVFMCKHTLGFL